MANENRVQIIITTDSTGAVTGIRGVEQETKRSVSEMERYWLRLGTAIAAAFSAYKAVDIIRDSTMIASRVETLGVVMEVVGRNAGYSKKEVEAYSESVRQMGITTQESHQTIIRMMQAQMDLNQASNLARVAQDAAVIGNINSSEALGRMIQGIQRGETEIMKTIGLNVNFENSYKLLAAQLGKNTDKLTEVEKVQARTNVTLEAGARIAGTYEAAMGTAGKQLLSLDRYIEEVQLKLGKLFTPTLSVAIQITTQALQDLNKQFDEFNESGEQASWAYGLAEGMKALAVYAIGVAAAFDIVGTAVGEFFAKVAQRAKNMVTSPVQYFKNIFNGETGTPGYDQTAATLDKYAALMDKIWKIGAGGGASKTETSSAIADVGTAAGMTAEEIKKLTNDMNSWRNKIDLLNPGLDEHERKLAALEAEAAKLTQEYGNLAWITEGLAKGKYFLEISRQIEESKKAIEEESKLWEERAKAEHQYNDQMEVLRADVIQRRILGEEAAARQIKDIAHKASATVEEYLEKEAQITELYEQKKLAILDEYRIKREKEVYEKEAAARERIMQMSMSGTGEAGELQAGLQMFQKGMWGLFNQAQGADPYSIELERLRLFWEEKTNLYLQGQAMIAEVNDAWNAYNLMQDQQTNMMRLQSAQYMTQSMMGIMSMLYNATGQQSQALFYMMKAAAVAQALVNAWLAYTQALATPMGVWSAGAYADMILAMGLAGAAAIAATAFMSPSTGAGVGGTATGGTAPVVQTIPAATAATAEKEDTKRPMKINIYVQGNIVDQDKFARELVPSITKAIRDGVAA
jgi:hypothetical protein